MRAAGYSQSSMAPPCGDRVFPMALSVPLVKAVTEEALAARLAAGKDGGPAGGPPLKKIGWLPNECSYSSILTKFIPPVFPG